MPGLAEDPVGFAFDDDRDLSLDKRETLELVRAYNRIPDAAVRKRLFELTKALANLDQKRRPARALRSTTGRGGAQVP